MHRKLHGSACCCLPEKIKYAWIKASLAPYVSLPCLVSTADAAEFRAFICDILVCVDKRSLIFSKKTLFSSEEHIKWLYGIVQVPLAWIQRSTQVYTEVFCQSCVWVQWHLESTCLKLNTCCHVFLSKPASRAWKLSKCSNLYYKLKQLK